MGGLNELNARNGLMQKLYLKIIQARKTKKQEKC